MRKDKNKVRDRHILIKKVEYTRARVDQIVTNSAQLWERYLDLCCLQQFAVVSCWLLPVQLSM